MNDEEADARVTEVVRRLKERREELGMSLNRLAERAGMSHVGVMQIENGERSPQLRTVFKLADALEVDVRELVGKADGSRRGASGA